MTMCPCLAFHGPRFDLNYEVETISEKPIYMQSNRRITLGNAEIISYFQYPYFRMNKTFCSNEK